MPYTHFANHADVWKHLALCEVLNVENPGHYLESNSAGADHTLSGTSEQQFGIGLFMERSKSYRQLTDSRYYQLQQYAYARNKYIGSPGLAMEIVGEDAKQMVFFDIEEPPLQNITAYANTRGISAKIITRCEDALKHLPEEIKQMPKRTFVHIDPYDIECTGPSGLDYGDLFVRAAKLGHYCFLWYGFHTLTEKMQRNRFLKNKLENACIFKYQGIELFLSQIRRHSIVCNPGIPGSGLLTANLSPVSNSLLLQLSQTLVSLYEGSRFEQWDTKLHRIVY